MIPQAFLEWMSVKHPATVLKGWQITVTINIFNAMPKGRRVGSMSFLLETIATFLRERAKPPAERIAAPAQNIYQITHQCFVTDHIAFTSTLFYGKDPTDALARYNELAAQRSAYPYYWNEVTIDSVDEIEVL